MNKKATFSMPVELLNQVRAAIGGNDLSHFVTSAVQEKLERSNSELKAAYAEAENDPDRNETINAWRALDN